MDVEHPFPETGPEDDETLPCGALLDDLEQRSTPPPGHEHCPHCADAISTLRTLEALVRAELEREPGGPDAAATLTEKIMRTVRTELRPGPLVPMGELTEELWITHAAAARAVRRMVDALPGIRAGACRITPVRAAVTVRSGRLPRGPVDVRLEIAISMGHSVAQAASLVRAVVVGGTGAELGLSVREIEIAVIDLLTSGTNDGRHPQ